MTLATGVGVARPLGFRAAGVAAGLKSSGARDLALVVNDGPSTSAAGVYTRNRVVAAPVVWSRDVTARGAVRAVVLNSGGANACTGQQGWLDAVDTVHAVSAALGVPNGEVALCSTGLIGELLPMPLLRAGIADAATQLSSDGGADAADAIRTTDTVSKTAHVDAAEFIVGGMAKGAGMLAPALATMLAVVTTDAQAEPATLDAVLRKAVSTTFERFDSDGCMSTNDTVLLLASGARGHTASLSELTEAVTSVCASLVRQMVADAEGASKDIRIEVINADTEADGVTVARAVARSNLFKCAIHGEDPNWGRVLAAVGTTDATFDPARLGVAMNGVWVARDGGPGDDRVKVDLAGRQVSVTVDLGAGHETATVWTNDLTADYVHENSAYSS